MNHCRQPLWHRIAGSTEAATQRIASLTAADCLGLDPALRCGLAGPDVTSARR